MLVFVLRVLWGILQPILATVVLMAALFGLIVWAQCSTAGKVCGITLAVSFVLLLLACLLCCIVDTALPFYARCVRDQRALVERLRRAWDACKGAWRDE